jgi:hypothetical protein
MAKAKDIIVQHEKKGPIKLGSLSHNELCRSVMQFMGENQKLQIMLSQAYMTYQNHLASIDASWDMVE